jgi:hypothetical protein
MSSTKQLELPEGFLTGPAPSLTKEGIDWKESDLPENEGSWAVILDGVMTGQECDTLLAAVEATTNAQWERAMVNIGNGMQALYEDTRNCGRIICDNRDLVGRIWARIEDAVPEIHQLKSCPNITGNGPAKRKETWKLSRLNERMRFLKYTGGEYFKGMETKIAIGDQS